MSLRMRGMIGAFTFSLGLIPASAGAQTESGMRRILLTKELSISESALPQGQLFENLRNIGIDHVGNIYVADAQAANIKVFSPSGKLLRIIGRPGQGPGEFQGPSLVEVNGEQLIVWENLLLRITIFDLEGHYLTSKAVDRKAFGDLLKIRALPNRNVLFETMSLGLRHGQLEKEWRLSILSSTLTTVKTLISHEPTWVKYLFAEPGFTGIVQPFSPRFFWDASFDGKIALGNSAQYRIDFFDQNGQQVGSLSGHAPPVRLEEQDKESYFSRVTAAVLKDGVKIREPKVPDYIRNNIYFPRFKPVFDGISFDSRGDLWVHTFQKNREREPGIFEVFSVNGTYLGQVEVSPSRVLGSDLQLRWGRDCLWAIEKDEDGIFRISKYRLSGS